ncbi:uncharacterized protein LOC143244615 [Tachypleus tridentatus]|uniref:uncharacterized protein LOC143244615 n=1 Tax=Tachypleus tridentatus TaxID=6853 RepID=UPI003FD0E7A0
MAIRHRNKVRNFLPCKNGHHARCDIGRSKDISYGNVLINHRPTRLIDHQGSDTQTLTPIELFDIKFRRCIPQNTRSASPTNISFISKDVVSIRSKKSKEQFNPFFEYVSNVSDDDDGGRSCDLDIDENELKDRSVASEDEFAEDELSLG